MTQNKSSLKISDLADSLKTASKIAKELGIDISAAGTWRNVIISNTLGHNLIKNRDNPLLDATKDRVNYSYLSAHYGKRAQIYLTSKSIATQKTNETNVFIIAFFSANDSSKIISIWSCERDTFWKEVNRQLAGKAPKFKSKPKSHLAFFSEAWLKLQNTGVKLLFENY